MGDITDIEVDDIKSLPTFRAAYSDRTALLMAKLAKRVYDPFNDDKSFAAFQSVFTPLGLQVCERLIDEDAGTAGAVLASPDLIVVVFRGTENLLDWRTNMRLAWTELQGGVKVHTGFFRAYQPIRTRLFGKVIALLAEKSRPVYITGHSLGGALAVMATAELANHNEAGVRDSIAACYTFGCPKAGDGSFDQYVKVPLYRITNGVDMVPAVPPVFSGYKHVGDTRYFGAVGIAPLRRPPSIVHKVWFTSLGLLQLWRTRKLIGIADHAMTRYILKLDAWIRAASEAAHERRKRTADRTL
jgi:hypothetical protein